MSFAQVSASALDSIEENVIGFALNGWAKGGVSTSTLESKALKEESVSEYLAYTDFMLGISARPSNETKATFDLRFHKDWQSAYREGNNTPIIRWWSYDGNIFDKKLKFNLGTMRIAYTPLTIYLPEPELILEPEMFTSLKKDAMEERYLDGTNRRLLQGLNLEYATSAGIFDNIFLQGTVARLRKVAEETDRISYDFDSNKDRYSMAARAGIETNGIYFGANDVYTFNRFGSSLKTGDTIQYEQNNVLSFELNYNSKKHFEGPLNFGIGAEYAFSNWSWYQDTLVTGPMETNVKYTTIPELPSGTPSSYPYYETKPSDRPFYERKKMAETNFKGALLGNVFVKYDDNPFEVKFSGHFLNTDKDFEAELAASPSYYVSGDTSKFRPILNSDATLEYDLQQFRVSSLENMYYSLYYTLPLNAITIVSGLQGSAGTVFGGRDPMFRSVKLDNNYKLAQYYRNSYTQQTYTRRERKWQFLDPAANLALPNGYATPDRKGGDADLSFVWNKAVNVKVAFGKYSSEAQGDYTRFGGGAEINIARLIDFSKTLTISGSYEQNKQENGLYYSPESEMRNGSYNPQINRIMAGVNIGIWRGLSLIGGIQRLDKEFENPYVLVEGDGGYLAVNKTAEILTIGGPQIKISERANFVLQGGLLSNAVTFIMNEQKQVAEINLRKYIVSGSVKVEF